MKNTQEDVLVNAVLQIAQGRVIDEGYAAAHIKFGSQWRETLNECAFLNASSQLPKIMNLQGFIKSFPNVALKAVIALSKPALKFITKWLYTPGVKSIEEFRGSLRPLTLGRPLKDLSNMFLIFELLSIIES